MYFKKESSLVFHTLGTPFSLYVPEDINIEQFLKECFKSVPGLLFRGAVIYCICTFGWCFRMMLSDVCLTMARISSILSSNGLVMACRPEQPGIRAVLFSDQAQSRVSTHGAMVAEGLLSGWPWPETLLIWDAFECTECALLFSKCSRLWIILGPTLHLAFQCMTCFVFLSTGNMCLLADRM